MPATDDDIRLTSIMAAPATPQGMPVSIDCNTQRVDDPQVWIAERTGNTSRVIDLHAERRHIHEAIVVDAVLQGIVEQSEAATDGCLAVSRHVISKAQPRAEVLPIGEQAVFRHA